MSLSTVPSVYLTSPNIVDSSVSINGAEVVEYVAHAAGAVDEAHVILTPFGRGAEAMVGGAKWRVEVLGGGVWWCRGGGGERGND